MAKLIGLGKARVTNKETGNRDGEAEGGPVGEKTRYYEKPIVVLFCEFLFD